MLDHLGDLPDLFHHAVDSGHHDWYQHVDFKDAHGNVTGHSTTDPTGSTTYTDAHGHAVGHSTLDSNGLTFHDIHGHTIGYDYPFGGVDHFLDINGHHIGFLDSLGHIHAASGQLAGQVTDSIFGTGEQLRAAHGELIASADSWFTR